MSTAFTRIFPLLCLFSIVGFSSEPYGLENLLKDELIQKIYYENPTRLGSGFAESGAVSVNAKWENKETDVYFIEQQRYGADFVAAGLFTGKKDIVDLGVKVLEWGFQRQGTNGGFDDSGDRYHSTTFFVEASARAALLLAASRDPAHQAIASRWRPRIEAAALWLADPVLIARFEQHQSNYTHRRWLTAAALGLAAQLTGRKDLEAKAAEFARLGMAAQLPNGVNPEKGGFDVNYQGVGILFASRYLSVCADPDIQAGTKTMLRKALDWQAGRFDAAGKVSLEGSSRVGGAKTETSRGGEQKKFDYKVTIQAFVYGSKIFPEPKYKDLAKLIAKGLGL
ncbi:MAG: hypothetical protein JNM63_05165 [Spirochaetia bacterium]|nr:hypothetical protein [Spirochaetia bacterium]